MRQNVIQNNFGVIQNLEFHQILFLGTGRPPRYLFVRVHGFYRYFKTFLCLESSRFLPILSYRYSKNVVELTNAVFIYFLNTNVIHFCYQLCRKSTVVLF